MPEQDPTSNPRTAPELDCASARVGWFAMARQQYIENLPTSPQDTARDFDIGVHLGGCATQACRELTQFYVEFLRSSAPEDSAILAHQVDELEARTMGTAQENQA